MMPGYDRCFLIFSWIEKVIFKRFSLLVQNNENPTQRYENEKGYKNNEKKY